MLARLQRIFRRHEDLETVAALSDRELADIGITREQALHLVALPQDVTERVVEMARIFGVPEDELQRNRAEWVEMLQVCDTCQHLPACQHLLQVSEFATPEAAGFCPNKANFERHASTD